MGLITMANLHLLVCIYQSLVGSADILMRKTPANAKLNMLWGCTALLRILNGKPLSL